MIVFPHDARVDKTAFEDGRRTKFRLPAMTFSVVRGETLGPIVPLVFHCLCLCWCRPARNVRSPQKNCRRVHPSQEWKRRRQPNFKWRDGAPPSGSVLCMQGDRRTPSGLRRMQGGCVLRAALSEGRLEQGRPQARVRQVDRDQGRAANARHGNGRITKIRPPPISHPPPHPPAPKIDLQGAGHSQGRQGICQLGLSATSQGRRGFLSLQADQADECAGRRRDALRLEGRGVEGLAERHGELQRQLC